MKLTNLLLFAAVILFGSCDSKSSEDQAELTLPASFEEFYTKFHVDSAFQMAHIVFPLSGHPSSIDSIHTERFEWQKEDWVLHRPVSILEFKKSYYMLDNSTITEQIYHPEGYGIERRFSKIGNEWNLIFYNAMMKI